MPMRDAFVIQTVTGRPAGSTENPWNPPVPAAEFSNPHWAEPNPMSPVMEGVGDNFVISPSAETVDAQNRAQVTELATRNQGNPDGTYTVPVNMSSANDCNDTPDKATDLSYGSSNTGREGGY